MLKTSILYLNVRLFGLFLQKNIGSTKTWSCCYYDRLYSHPALPFFKKTWIIVVVSVQNDLWRRDKVVILQKFGTGTNNLLSLVKHSDSLRRYQSTVPTFEPPFCIVEQRSPNPGQRRTYVQSSQFIRKCFEMSYPLLDFSEKTTSPSTDLTKHWPIPKCSFQCA